MVNLPTLKRKPSGIYYLDLRGQGLGRVSLETRDRAVALEKRREYALGINVIPLPQPSRLRGNVPTMRELFDRAENTVWREVKAQATIRSNIKILNGIIGDEPVTAMNFTRLSRLVEELRSLGYAPGTVKRKMDAVSKVLKMAASHWTDDEGRPLLAAKPPMPTIRVENTKDRTISPAEEAAIFAAIEKRRIAEPARQWRRFAALIRFLLDTGARLGEALDTGPDDLTTIHQPRKVTLVTFGRYRTKNDKPRQLPLTTTVQAALASLEDDIGNRNGKAVYFPMNQGTAWYMWSNIRNDLSELGFDIQEATLHTLRHTCLTRLAQGGMELLRLQKWAGHSDPKITAERYIHLDPNDLAGGLDILEAPIGGNPANVIFMEAGAKRAQLGTVSA